MADYFFDTSALVKRHVIEVGSAWVRSLVHAKAAPCPATKRAAVLLIETDSMSGFFRTFDEDRHSPTRHHRDFPGKTGPPRLLKTLNHQKCGRTRIRDRSQKHSPLAKKLENWAEPREGRPPGLENRADPLERVADASGRWVSDIPPGFLTYFE
jgi:hypothetical protein